MAARTVPVTATKSPGDLLTGALWNGGPYALANFMLSVPLFCGTQTATQTVANNTWTSMNLQAESIDTDNGHSTVTNNTRYTAQVAGWYWVEGYIALNGGSASRFAAYIGKNGSPVAGSMQTTYKLNDLQSISASTLVSLNVNDYVEVYGYQNSGGSISTFNGTDLCPSLNVIWMYS